jgi:hypothetical protein
VVTRWQISRIRSTPAAILGRIETSDDDPESAIQEAIKQFGITDPVHQQRLAARRVK